MSKRKRSSRRSTPSREQQRQTQSWASIAVPIVVGVAVLVVIAGAILLAESQRPAASSSSSVNTAQPLDTQPIPYPNVPRVSLQDTQDLLAQGQAVLVDVRSKASYDQAHAVGALSIPEEEIDARLSELPRDKTLILYCT